MMTLKESQKTLKEHSEVKIRLLKLYLESYLSILYNSPTVHDIYLFDLFCGEGIYNNGGKGSPITILETIYEVQRKRQSVTKFHCHFNDIDQEKIRKLEEYILEKGFNSRRNTFITFSSYNYRELVPNLYRKFKRFSTQRAFIFIDPYGYKDIRLDDLRLLLESNYTEVLLFLPTQFMFRFASYGTPESLKSFINDLVPENLWPHSSTGLDFIENLKNEFRRYFSFSKKHYVDSFIITRYKNQYFCLFFFTSHILGFEKMLEAKWKIDAGEGRGWTYELENTLFSKLTKTPNITNFIERLRQFLKDRERSNHDVYYFTVTNGFLPRHSAQVLKDFQGNGELVVTGTDGKPVRKSAFYINYRYYTREPNKVKIELK